MTDDQAARLWRQALFSQRVKVPAAEDHGADVLLPENVVRFLRAEVSPPLQRKEHLGALFLDDAIRPIAFSMPYRGYLGRTRIEPHKIVSPCMMVGATSLIAFHNRHRGRRAATRRDATVARDLRRGCELLGLRLLDFLVLGAGDAFTSLREEGRVRFHSLGGDPPGSARDGRARVEPKYRNPDPPHQTWSGRGRMAKWLADRLEADDGAKLEDFLIGDGSRRAEEESG